MSLDTANGKMNQKETEGSAEIGKHTEYHANTM